MPKKSIVVVSSVAAAVVVVGAAATITAAAGGSSHGKTVVTVDLWDDGVAAAYKQSFAQFEKQNPDIDVKVVVTPWASYFQNLQTDVGGGTAADVFWLNSAFTQYADNGNLLDVGKALGPSAQKGWDPAVVAQYTRNGTLWGVPQLADGGKAILYNKKLVAQAGLTESDLAHLTWDPAGTDDTLLPVLQKLTRDKAGHTADSPDFNPKAVSQFGYNAAYDPDAIVFNYVGSGGGTWNTASAYTFADAPAAAAIGYTVDLVTKYHVAPTAADTNQNGSFSEDQFLQGHLALFETGLYSLGDVSTKATIDWGVVAAPTGPAGNKTVTNGIIAAGNAHSEHLAATKKVLAWLGSTDGSKPIGASGAALPAVLGAQDTYRDLWKSKGIDVSPFFDGQTFTLTTLQSTHTAQASDAYTPILQQIYLGQLGVADGLKKAQDAANAALAG